MITEIEELSLNAWPAHQTFLYDGWVLRFVEGYTKRANSVNPLYASNLDLDKKISYCEQIYQGQKLDVVFKLTPASCPDDLDQTLSSKGYRKDSPTSVQVLELNHSAFNSISQVEIEKALSDSWLDAFCRTSAVDTDRRKSLQQILLGILPPHCFASLSLEDQVIACGLGVLQSGYIGLFDIVVDEDFRKRGYGQQIVESILSWGKANGARRSYLQVMLNNPPALRLYSRIGFVEQYLYWYRVK